MPDLSKYLEKAYAKKKVDEISAESPKPSLVNPETLQPANISATYFSNLVDDVLATAAETQRIIQGVIDKIYETNKADANFKKYAELAALTFFDMKELLTNQDARPNATPSNLHLYEKDVYRRLVDPRAPFLQDLYRMMTETTLSEFMMKRVWEKGANIPDGPGDRLGRLSLYKEKQYLSSTQRQAQAIGELERAPISTWDVRSLAEKLMQVAESEQETFRSIGDVVDSVKHLQQLMQMSMLTSTITWEKFGDILANIFFDPIALASARMQREISYPWFRKTRETILDIVSVIHIIPTGGILSGMAEMKNQAEEGLFLMLKNMEEDLLTKEKKATEIEEARMMLLLNVYKVSYSKNLIHLLGAVIGVLEGFSQGARTAKDASSGGIGQEAVKESLMSLSNTWPEELAMIISIKPGTDI